MKKWIGNGADPAKLVLGLPLYGLTFTLANASNSGFLAPTTGPGPAGPVTMEPGYLGYKEVGLSLAGRYTRQCDCVSGEDVLSRPAFELH